MIRRVLAFALVPGVVAGVVIAAVSLASADTTRNPCAVVAAGESSGWCGLYPGNATGNVKELGNVSVSASGTSLTVQTQDAGTDVVPKTSFACLTLTPASAIDHRLQDTQCSEAGGTWFPFSGTSLTIDLNAYPQFLNTQFSVQVAANKDANNSNGDAFYNTLSVSTVAVLPA